MNGERYLAGSGGPPRTLNGYSQEYPFPSRWSSFPCVKTDQAVFSRQAVSGHELANNSHDLNPIKNGWNYMKNKLNDEDISSVPKL
jgi:hypothetical protein